MMRRSSSLALVLVLLAIAPADAQLRRRASGGALGSTTRASADDAFVLERSPADLARTAGWNLSYVHEERVVDVVGGQGDLDSAAFVSALPFGLGVGVGVDASRPTGGALFGRFSFGLGWQSGGFATGAVVRGLAGGGPFARGATTLDFGVSYRATGRLAFALNGFDLLSPSGLGGAADALPATGVLTAQVRPFADESLLVEASGAVDADGRVGVEGRLHLRVPHVGRAFFAVQAEDLSDARDLRLAGGVALDWERLALVAHGFGDPRSEQVSGFGVGANFGSRRRTGVPAGGYVWDIRVPSAGGRSLLALLAKLDRARRDPMVAGVMLRLRGTHMGMAAAQELRQAIAAVRNEGKAVACYFTTPNGSSVYACGEADARWIDPAGHVQLLGTAFNVRGYGPFLRNLGVRMEVLRIGTHKSWAETYIGDASTGPAREQREALLDDVEARFQQDLAQDLDTDRAEIARLVDEGPYLADEAEEAGLVTGLLDETELREAAREVFGARRLRERPARDVPQALGRPRHVAVVVIDGSIVDGENVDYPIIEIHSSGGDTLVPILERLRADPRVAAVVLRVDSPGGSALASDQIWRAVRRLREAKPVVASMGSVAASGGYYVACGADVVFADPTTLTGSIGIFFGKIDVAQLAEWVGARAEVHRRGANAGNDTFWRPFEPRFRGILADKVRRSYRQFLSRVAESRAMSVAEVHAVGEGRIFSGDRAVRLGLVDRLGGFVAALDEARRRAGLAPDAPVAFMPQRPGSLLDYALGFVGGAETAAAEDFAALREAGLSESEIGNFANISHALVSSGDFAPLALSPVLSAP